MADHKLDIETQQTMLPFIIQSTELVSQIDPSVFEAVHTDSELFMNKFQFERNDKSVVLTSDFELQLMDSTLNEVYEARCQISYHFVDTVFRSIVVSAVLYDHNQNVYMNMSAMNPFHVVSRPAVVNRVCFSFYIGSKKYLISDEFYDIIDFEAQAFQESTLSENSLGLSLAQQIIEIMGVNK